MNASVPMSPTAPLLRLSLPWAPVPAGRPRTAVIGGRARIFQPSKTRTAQALLRAYAEEHLPAGWAPLDGAVAVSVTAWLPMPASMPKYKRATALPTGRPDVDNLARTVLDALSGLVFVDDARIVALAIRKRYAAPGTSPRWDVSVSAAAPAQPQSAATPTSALAFPVELHLAGLERYAGAALTDDLENS